MALKLSIEPFDEWERDRELSRLASEHWLGRWPDRLTAGLHVRRQGAKCVLITHPPFSDVMIEMFLAADAIEAIPVVVDRMAERHSSKHPLEQAVGPRARPLLKFLGVSGSEDT